MLPCNPGVTCRPGGLRGCVKSNISSMRMHGACQKPVGCAVTQCFRTRSERQIGSTSWLCSMIFPADVPSTLTSLPRPEQCMTSHCGVMILMASAPRQRHCLFRFTERLMPARTDWILSSDDRVLHRFLRSFPEEEVTSIHQAIWLMSEQIDAWERCGIHLNRRRLPLAIACSNLRRDGCR